MLPSELPTRLALSTSLYEFVPLAEVLPKIAELGFRHVELVADGPQFFPAQWSIGQVSRLRAQLEACELTPVNLCAETGRGFFSPMPPGPVYEPSLITPQPSGRRLRLQHVRRCLDFAYMLGSPCVTLATGACLPGVTPAQGWDLLLDALTVVLSHAEELRLRVAIVPRPGHLVGRVEDLLSLLAIMPHPLLGTSLDLAELALRGEPLEPALVACAGRIWTLQATDAKAPLPYRLRPGMGEIDWSLVLRSLALADFEGPLTLHLENYVDRPEVAIQETLAFMTGLAYTPAIAS